MKLNVQSKNNVATGIAGEDEKMKYNKFPLTKINFIMMAVSGLLIIAGFIPVFFDNATIAIFANNRGGIKASMIFSAP